MALRNFKKVFIRNHAINFDEFNNRSRFQTNFNVNLNFPERRWKLIAHETKAVNNSKYVIVFWKLCRARKVLT